MISPLSFWPTFTIKAGRVKEQPRRPAITGLRLSGHSRKRLSLTSKPKPRLGATAEQLDSWIEA
jgi:hypothetical protein